MGKISLGLSLLALIATEVLAADPWQFSGFASLATTHNDSEALEFRRDIAQDRGVGEGDWDGRTDSLLGLQLSYPLSPRLELTGQVVAKQRVEQNFDESLEWAFLRYRPQDGSDLRLGRMGLDIFMLSDYRHVAYAYPWVRPPQEFYGILQIYHYDGVDYTQRFEVGGEPWGFKLFVGRSAPTLPSGDEGFRLELEPIAGLSLFHEGEVWRARLSYTMLELGSEPPTDALRAALDAVAPFWPQAPVYAVDLQLEGTRAEYLNAGLAYDDNDWLIQAEVAQLKADSLLAPSGKSAYLSLGRRFGALTAYALFGKARPDRAHLEPVLPPLPDPPRSQLEPLRDALEFTLHRSRVDQDSMGLGLRWDLATRKALKLEWDHKRVAVHGAGLWLLSGENDREESANVLSLSLDLLF